VSFTVRPSAVDSQLENDLERIGEYDLLPRCSILVPALSFATIPHAVSIETHGTVMLIPSQEALRQHSLLVSPCIVKDGDVTTYVFNLANREYKVLKSMVLSTLVAL